MSQPTTTVQTLVAICYSAGGLKSLIKFFDDTPCDNASYVVLNHVPPNSISQLRQILKSHSRLEVIVALNNHELENNKVYLVPPACYLKLNDGNLLTSSRSVSGDRINYSMDIFLESLAKEKKFRKIVVFFSGYGTDGIKGAAKIKQQGGNIIVQDPETCYAKALPESIIKTTIVDAILIPEKMPELIQEMVSN